MSALNALPRRIPAGTSVALLRTHSAYPASAGWTLKLHLAFPTALAITASASGDNYALVLTPSQLAIAAGVYQWAERVTKGSEGYQVAAGLVQILPDLSTATAAELKSWAETTLVIVEAAIAGKLARGFESYQIGGRTLVKIPLEEQKQIRRELIEEIRGQRNPGRLGRTFHAHF